MGSNHNKIEAARQFCPREDRADESAPQRRLPAGVFDCPR